MIITQNTTKNNPAFEVFEKKVKNLLKIYLNGCLICKWKHSLQGAALRQSKSVAGSSLQPESVSLHINFLQL